ncbi:hypothetical protein MASR1M6_26930 [Rubrivivax sp.]
MADVAYLGHAWSLSIEEQFYALWPLLFTLLIPGAGARGGGAAAGRARRRFGGLALVACRRGAGLARMYNGTDVRLDGLCLGAALAFVRKGCPWLSSAQVVRILGLALPAIALVLFVWGFRASYYDRQWYLWRYAGVHAAVRLLVAGLVLCPRTALHPLLEGGANGLPRTDLPMASTSGTTRSS